MEITFNHIVREESGIHFQNETVNTSNIKEFGIINRPSYTAKRSFKAWRKMAFIRLKDGMYYGYASESVVAEIKDAMKAEGISYETKKDYQEQTKGFSIRKAVDWTFTVK